MINTRERGSVLGHRVSKDQRKVGVMPTRVRHGTGPGTSRGLVPTLPRIAVDIMGSQPIRDELQKSAHVPQMSAQIRCDELSLVVGAPFGDWLILVAPLTVGWGGTTLVSR